MTARKRLPPDDPEQSARFIEAAKADGIEEVGAAFQRGLVVLAPATKPNPKTVARKPKRAKRA